MKKGRVLLGCKVTLALAIIEIFIAPMAVSEDLICSVSGQKFDLDGQCTVTKIVVSHSTGAQSGWISLIDQGGSEYGPWNADTRSPQWVVRGLDLNLMAGRYRLIDSDPATYQKQAWIYGIKETPPEGNLSIER
jgi:hypothetical protein